MGETDIGHAVIMEASASKMSAGPSPLEILLIGVGACASSDVVSLLRQIRQNVDDITLEIGAKRADSVPSVFTKIQAVFTVTGRGLSLAKTEEAVDLSAEKYCSASRMF